MLAHLDLEPGLQHLPDHRRQQPVIASELDAFSTSTSDKLLGPLAHRPSSPVTAATLRPSLLPCAAMNMILPSPRHPVADPQITPDTEFLTAPRSVTRGRRRYGASRVWGYPADSAVGVGCGCSALFSGV